MLFGSSTSGRTHTHKHNQLYMNAMWMGDNALINCVFFPLQKTTTANAVNMWRKFKSNDNVTIAYSHNHTHSTPLDLRKRIQLTFVYLLAKHNQNNDKSLLCRSLSLSYFFVYCRRCCYIFNIVCDTTVSFSNLFTANGNKFINENCHLTVAALSTTITNNNNIYCVLPYAL